MLDLLGDSITTPCESSTRMTQLLNSAHGFVDWWKAWPKSPRKAAKQQCLDKWARLELAANAGHIIAHTEWMKTQPDWTKENGAFICAPLVYLNQQRWSEWEAVTVPDKTARHPELIKLDNDSKNRAPMPQSVRDLLQKTKQGLTA